MSASAATKAVDSSAVTFTYDEHKELFYAYLIPSGGIANFYTEKAVPDAPEVDITLVHDFVPGGGKLEANSVKRNGTKGVYMVYHSTVTVPAGSTYRVDYNFDWTSTKNSDDGGEGSAWAHHMHLLGEDTTALNTASIDLGGLPNITPQVQMKRDSMYRGSSSGSSSFKADDYDQIVYTNTDTVTKSFDTYFLYSVGMRANNNWTSGFDCSVDMSVNVTEEYMEVPSDLTTTYNGNNHWLDTFSDAWIDPDYHLNSEYTTIKSIKYSNVTGDIVDASVQSNEMINAGVYTVTLSPVGIRWSDETTEDKTFKITVNQAVPTVVPIFASEPTYLPEALPAIDYNAGGIKGEIKWNDGQMPKVGTNKYYWTFIPKDDSDPTVANNYAVVENNFKEFTFSEQEIKGIAITAFNTQGEKVFTNTTEATLRSWLTVTLTYKDTTIQPKETKSYTLEIDTSDGKLHVGSNFIKVSIVDPVTQAKIKSDPFEIENVEELTYTALEDIKLNKTTFTYPVKAEDILKEIKSAEGMRNDNRVVDISDFSIIELVENTDLTAGTNKSLSFKIKDSTAAPKSVSGITIEKGTHELSGITFEPVTVTYDESAHEIVFGGTLPAGVSAKYSYTNKGGNTTEKNAGSDKFSFTDAGEYEVVLKFENTDANYNAIPANADITAKLTINQAELDLSAVQFGNKTVHAEAGKSYTLTYTGTLPQKPANITVTYSVTGEGSNTSFSDAGKYEFVATFSHGDPNYKDNVEKKATLTVSIKDIYDLEKLEIKGAGDDGRVTVSGDYGNGYTAKATYDGKTVEIAIDPANLDGGNLPDGLTQSGAPKYEKKKADGTWEEITGLPTGAGEYRVTVLLDNAKDEYEDPDAIVIALTIDKADIDASNKDFTPPEGSALKESNGGYTATYKPDTAIEIGVSDITAPDGATAKTPVYKKLKEGGDPAVEADWETVSEIKEAGEYKVVVDFEPTDKDNYNDNIEALEIRVSVNAAQLKNISAGIAAEASFTADDTLDAVKEKLNAKKIFDNGTEEELEAAEVVLTSENLRDGGKMKAGTQVITVTYNDGEKDYTATVEITVQKVKVKAPVYSGTLSYTGAEVKPATDDFTGYDEALMSFVETKLQLGFNAGSYKAVFALNDTDNYEWAASALKKSLFAAKLYDEEITLAAGETAVDWSLAKAKITATRTDDALPVFKSDNFAALPTGTVGLKYYKDEACTQEVAAADLLEASTYYVKAELLDTANFDLDASAVAYTAPFSYTTPAGEPTLWDKIVSFLKANWLWLVIALVALILLITIIACCARASKKKKARLAEEKAEKLAREEREREERRLEREERMARLSQQQSAPAPQYIPQPMPQMMPQMPMQSMGGGMSGGMSGGNSMDGSQFAQIQSELAAIKAEQSAAKELAAVRAAYAEKMMDNAKWENEFAKLHGDQVAQSGVTMQTLTELVEATVKRVMENNANPVEQKPTDGTQVPPDAVMTTVTTTKIDTTKKTAQNGQEYDRDRNRSTRSFVAPMPVDDGRVFDVGGFYKPADPSDLVEPDEDGK